jgi:stearoyl-CoA desaturase (delta-9 desaturase)
MSNNAKIKLMQAVIYLYGFYTLIFQWDAKLFFISLALGQFLILFGVTLGLHRYSAHQSYTPKNNFIKAFLLYVGTLCGVGSAVQWSIVHRTHHKYTDVLGKDPHCPENKWWQSIKVWFFFYNMDAVRPRIIKDLANDPMHKFFHRHYFKILLSSVAVIALFSGENFGYFYALPVLSVMIANGYITTLAHLTWLAKNVTGYRNFNSPDTTYNSKLFAAISMGEGFHNNHHAYPGAWKYSMVPGEFDLGHYFVRWLGIPKSKAIQVGTPIENEGWPMDQIKVTRTEF